MVVIFAKMGKKRRGGEWQCQRIGRKEGVVSGARNWENWEEEMVMRRSLYFDV